MLFSKTYIQSIQLVSPLKTSLLSYFVLLSITAPLGYGILYTKNSMNIKKSLSDVAFINLSI